MPEAHARQKPYDKQPLYLPFLRLGVDWLRRLV